MPNEPARGSMVAEIAFQGSVISYMLGLFFVGPYLISVCGWQTGILMMSVALALELIIFLTITDLISLKALAKDLEPNTFKEVPNLGFNTHPEWTGARKGYKFHFLLASTTWIYAAIYLALVAMAWGFHHWEIETSEIHWAVTPLGLSLVLVAFSHLRQLRAEAAYYAAWSHNPADPDISSTDPSPYMPELRFTAKAAAWVTLAGTFLALVVALLHRSWVEGLSALFLYQLMKLTIPMVTGCRNDLTQLRLALVSKLPREEW